MLSLASNVFAIGSFSHIGTSAHHAQSQCVTAHIAITSTEA